MKNSSPSLRSRRQRVTVGEFLLSVMAQADCLEFHFSVSYYFIGSNSIGGTFYEKTVLRSD
jgi:hypothetical protein